MSLWLISLHALIAETNSNVDYLPQASIYDVDNKLDNMIEIIN